MGEPKKINVALQGGGAHGAVTWGVLDRLLEDERISIESISGTSAGAVNAVALAAGLHEGRSTTGRGRDAARAKLDELWDAISDIGAFYTPLQRGPWDFAGIEAAVSYQIFDALTRTFSPYQFNPFNINPLRVVLERCIDFGNLRQCKTLKLFLSATNVRSGKIKIFTADAVSADVVLASACLPFLFQAVEIDGEHYWDGGYMGNPPLFPFFYHSESQDVVIIHVNPLDRDEIPRTAPEILNRMNEISFNSSLLGELRAIGFVQKLLNDDWLKDEYRDRLRNIRIHSIRSDDAIEDLNVASKYDIDRSFLSDLKARGRSAAESWLQRNFETLGEASSVDVRMLYDPGVKFPPRS